MSVQWLAALPPDVFGDKAWKITSQWCRPTYNHWRDTFSPTLSDNISRRIEMSQDGKLNVQIKPETTIYLSYLALYLYIIWIPYMGKTSKSECRWWWPESSFVCLSDQNEFYAAMAIFWQTSSWSLSRGATFKLFAFSFSYRVPTSAGAGLRNCAWDSLLKCPQESNTFWRPRRSPHPCRRWTDATSDSKVSASL